MVKTGLTSHKTLTNSQALACIDKTNVLHRAAEFHNIRAHLLLPDEQTQEAFKCAQFQVLQILGEHIIEQKKAGLSMEEILVSTMAIIARRINEAV